MGGLGGRAPGGDCSMWYGIGGLRGVMRGTAGMKLSKVVFSLKLIDKI